VKVAWNFRLRMRIPETQIPVWTAPASPRDLSWLSYVYFSRTHPPAKWFDLPVVRRTRAKDAGFNVSSAGT
jgi:hypothetical protein